MKNKPIVMIHISALPFIGIQQILGNCITLPEEILMIMMGRLQAELLDFRTLTGLDESEAWDKWIEIQRPTRKLLKAYSCFEIMKGEKTYDQI